VRPRKAPQGDEEFIVKVQLSIPTLQALAYNEAGSVYGQFDASTDLIGLMDGRPKAFFFCRLKDSQLVIDREAPWQDW
jgi:hypothetical protein